MTTTRNIEGVCRSSLPGIVETSEFSSVFETADPDVNSESISSKVKILSQAGFSKLVQGEVLNNSTDALSNATDFISKLAAHLESIVKLFSRNVSHDIVFLTNIMVSFYNIIISPSLTSFLINLAKMLVDITGVLHKFNVAYVTKTFKKFKEYNENSSLNKVKTQGKLNDFTNAFMIGEISFHKILSTVADSRLVKSVSEFLQIVIASQVLPAPRIEEYFDRYVGKKKEYKDLTMFDLLNHSLEASENLVRAVIRSTGANDIFDFFSGDDLSQWLDTTRVLIAKKELVKHIDVKDGNVESYIPVSQYLEELRFYANKASTLICDDKKKKVLKQLRLVELTETFASFTAAVAGVTRKPPVAFIISGPPKIGKSAMMIFIQRALCKYEGMTYSNKMNYDFPKENDHMDSYEPLIHTCISFHELGSETQMALRDGGSALIVSLLTVCDSQAMLAKKADLPSKGQHYVMPKLVLIDTNNPNLNLNLLVMNPAAVRRRFLFLTMKVREEYADSHGSISEAKISANPPLLANDIWSEIKVIRKDPITNVDSLDVCIFYATGTRVLQKFLNFLLALFKQKDEDYKLLRSAFDDDIDKYFDPFLSIEDLPVQTQGDLNPLPASSMTLFFDTIAFDVFDFNPEDCKSYEDIVGNKNFDTYTAFDKYCLLLYDVVSTYVATCKKKFVDREDISHTFFPPQLVRIGDYEFLKEMTFLNKRVVLYVNEKKDFDMVEYKPIYSFLCKLHNRESEFPNGGLLSDADIEYNCRKRYFIDNTVPWEENQEVIDYLEAHPDLTASKLLVKKEEVISRVTASRNVTNGQMNPFDDDFDSGVYVEAKSLSSDDSLHPLKREDVLFEKMVCTADSKKKEKFTPKRYPVWNFVGTSLAGRTFLYCLSILEESKATFSDRMFMHSSNMDMWPEGRVERTKFLARMLFEGCSSILFDSCLFSLLFNSFLFSFGFFSVAAYAFIFELACYTMVNGFDAAWFRFFPSSYAILSHLINVFDNAYIGCNKLIDAGRYLLNNGISGRLKDAVFRSMLPGYAELGSLTFVLFLFVTGCIKAALLTYGHFFPITSQMGAPTEDPMYVEVKEKNKRLEEVIEAGFVRKTIKRANDPSYLFKIDDTHFPSSQISFNKPKEVFSYIRKNLRSISHVYNEGGFSKQYCLGLKGDWALINKHGFSFGDNFVVSDNPEEMRNGKTYNIKDCLTYDVGEDVYLVRLFGCEFIDILPLIDTLGFLKLPTNGIFRGADVLVNPGDPVTANCREFNFHYKDTSSYETSLAEFGTCGIPVLIQRGDLVTIIGIHCAGNSKGGYCSNLKRSRIEDCLIQSQASPVLPVLSQGSFRLPKGRFCTHNIPLKHSINFEETSGLDVICGLEGQDRVQVKSQLKKSLLYDDLVFLINESPILPDGRWKYGPAVFKPFFRNEIYYSPLNNWIKKVSVVKKVLPFNSLHDCILLLYADMEKRINNFDNNLVLKPFDFRTAVNGALDNSYVRSISFSKSGGFSFPGTKRKYIYDLPFDGKPDAKEPSIDVMNSVHFMISEIMAGRNPNGLFGAQMKDELRSREKLDTANTRIFAMSSFDSLVLARIIAAPFYTFMVEQRELFCTRVGINMYSRDANDLFNSLSNFSDNIIEGDYGGYDTSMPIEIGIMANSLIYMICKRYGYNQKSLDILQGNLSDGLYPKMIFDQVILTSAGFQPSGKYATAEDNSLRGLFIIYYAYLIMLTPIGKNSPYNQTIQFSEKDFFKYCYPVTYGDDMLCSVKLEISSFFNAITYGNFVKFALGMTFTDARKNSHIAPFITCNDMTFLKRSFVVSKILNRRVAVLEKQSIAKSLAWIMRSKNINESEQVLQTVASAMLELFFHSNDLNEYKQYRLRFHKVLRERFPEFNDVILAAYLPTARQIMKNLNEEHEYDPALDDLGGAVDFYVNAESRSLDEFTGARVIEENLSISGNPLKVEGEGLTNQSHLLGRSLSKDRLFSQTGEWQQNTQSDKQMSVAKTNNNNNETITQQFVDNQISATNAAISALKKDTTLEAYEKENQIEDLLSHLADLKKVRRSMDAQLKLLYDSRRMQKQSLFENEDYDYLFSHMPKVKKVENHDFEIVHSQSGVVKMAEPTEDQNELNDLVLSPILPIIRKNDDVLDRFLFAFTDTMSSALNTDYSKTYSPWSILSDSSVVPKISNYAYFKCDVEVQVTVNSSPRNKGWLYFSYIPAPTETMSGDFAIIGTSAGTNDTRRIKALQAKIQMSFDLSESGTKSFKIPFIYKDQMAPILTKNSSGNFTSAHLNPTDFGYIYIFTTYFHHPSDTSPASYSVQHKIVDLQLSTPTQVVAQSGILNAVATSVTPLANDEYSDSGPIAKIASASSNVVARLTDIPIIGRLAKSTSMFLGKLGKAADIFGFSKPVNIDKTCKTQFEYFDNGVYTSGFANVSKFSMDPKQELSIQPMVPVVESELSISFIGKQIGCLGNLVIAPSTLNGAVLASFPVTPLLYAKNAGNGGEIAVMPCMMAAQYFNFWRGDVVFKFRAAFSGMDSYKVRIIYDPFFVPRTTLAPLTSVAYTLDWDLSVEKEIDVSLGYNSTRRWTRTYTNQLFNTAGAFTFNSIRYSGFGASAEITALIDQGNATGCLYLVQMSQAVTLENSPVVISVHVWAENLLVNAPSQPIFTGAGRQPPDPEVQSQMGRKVLVPSQPIPSDVNLIHFGESIGSFKQLLQREMPTYRVTLTANQNSFTHTIYPVLLRDHIPLTNGQFNSNYDNTGTSIVTTTSASFNLFRELSTCFLGHKGGYRYKMYLMTDQILNATVVALYSNSPTSPIVSGSSSEIYTLDGGINYKPDVGAGISYEIPYQSMYLFNTTASSTAPAFSLGYDYQSELKGVRVQINKVSSSSSVLNVNSSASDDFNMFFFIHAPVYANVNAL